MRTSLNVRIANARVMGLTAIASHQIKNLGLTNASYFSGATAHGTAYDDVVVGSGDTQLEAYQQALALLADLDIDTAYLPNSPRDISNKPMPSEKQEHGEYAYFVGIYYSLKQVAVS